MRLTSPQFLPGRFDATRFLSDYWQRKSLLIRNPWADWRNPLAPDELAGMACEPQVESRLVVQAQGGWQLEPGPLPEERFAALGGDPWTLLVQAVDHYVPDVADLIQPFRFIPDWRIDDVMVSYAVDGGGVGPHFDRYDVFLVQGLGQRRWQIGDHCDEHSGLLPHDDLRLLSAFVAREEWVLEPGDILYVPPHIAHQGVAIGDDCMTYSIGFRAPSVDELIAGWSDHLLEQGDEDRRYTDPALPRQDNPGQITPLALARLQALVTERLDDGAAFARWFGRHSTEPKSPIDWRPEDAAVPSDVARMLGAGGTLIRNPASRFAFVDQEPGATLFVDGEAYDCVADVAAFARLLCAQPSVAADAVPGKSEAVLGLVTALIDSGALALEAQD